MTDFNHFFDLMKKCDQRSDQLLDMKEECHQKKLVFVKNDLNKDLKSLLKTEPQITEIVKNEELIKLYFYRFLVSDHKTNQEFNGYYLRAKEKCKQLLVEFFATMANVVSNSSDNNLNIESNSDLLAKVLKQFQTKAMKSMAENEIKSYEKKQLLQKLVSRSDSNE